MLPKKIYLNYVDEADEDKTWSEEPISVYDCKMHNREYTDLSQVWHDASEEPENHSNIVVIDKSNNWWDLLPYNKEDYDYYGMHGWKACVNNYLVIRWAYIDDLLPKGGEK